VIAALAGEDFEVSKNAFALRSVSVQILAPSFSCRPTLAFARTQARTAGQVHWLPIENRLKTFRPELAGVHGSVIRTRTSRIYARAFLSAHRAFIMADSFFRIAGLIGLRLEDFFWATTAFFVTA
jgi:hypothetical protein